MAGKFLEVGVQPFGTSQVVPGVEAARQRAFQADKLKRQIRDGHNALREVWTRGVDYVRSNGKPTILYEDTYVDLPVQNWDHTPSVPTVYGDTRLQIVGRRIHNVDLDELPRSGIIVVQAIVNSTKEREMLGTITEPAYGIGRIDGRYGFVLPESTRERHLPYELIPLEQTPIEDVMSKVQEIGGIIRYNKLD